MAILTGLTTIQKGQQGTLTLDKTELFALAPVIADPYFSVESNVDKSIFFYVSATGNQKEVVIFDLSQASPQATVDFSLTSLDNWNVEKIILLDFDGGSLVVQGNDIPANLGIDLSGSTPQPYSVTFTNPGTVDFYMYSDTNSVNVTVDWGDGSQPEVISGESGFATHNYDPGTYTATISGSTSSIECYSPTGDVAITSWGDLGLTSLGWAVSGCSGGTVTVPNYIPTTVTSLESMFSQTTNFNQNISMWDTSNITNMSAMFYDCIYFNQPIGSWVVDNVTNMNSMFDGCTAFNQALSGWLTTNVTDMQYMFHRCSNFNQDIGIWNVSNVLTMDAMFSFATNFDQDLSGWCVTNIPFEPASFASSSALNVSFYPVWGTCPV